MALESVVIDSENISKEMRLIGASNYYLRNQRYKAKNEKAATTIITTKKKPYTHRRAFLANVSEILRLAS